MYFITVPHVKAAGNLWSPAGMGARRHRQGGAVAPPPWNFGGTEIFSSVGGFFKAANSVLHYNEVF